MADKMTHVGTMALRGIVPPAEARAERRRYWEGQLARAQKELARPATEIEVTYWQGSRRLHPECEDRPAVTVPVPNNVTPLGFDRGLLLEAAELTIESQFASPSFLQRKMRIGFAKAGRLMTLMEERGIVSPANNRFARDVLVPREDKARALAAVKSEDCTTTDSNNDSKEENDV